MHSAKVCHRDLKPGNILLDSQCRVYLADLGLARKLNAPLHEDPEQSTRHGATEYVVTRWYRAPEVLLNCTYDLKLDIWSVGCIFAELVNREPLFPGKDYVHQIKLICEGVGIPESRGDDGAPGVIPSSALFNFLLSNPIAPRTELPRLVSPLASEDMAELLLQMLEFNPVDRIDASSALDSEFLAPVHNDGDWRKLAMPSTCTEFLDPTIDQLEEEVALATALIGVLQTGGGGDGREGEAAAGGQSEEEEEAVERSGELLEGDVGIESGPS